MRITATILLLLAFGVLAQALNGRVVSIADGDTLTILDASNSQTKIRLHQIDVLQPYFGHPTSLSRHSVLKVPG